MNWLCFVFQGVPGFRGETGPSGDPGPRGSDVSEGVLLLTFDTVHNYVVMLYVTACLLYEQGFPGHPGAQGSKVILMNMSFNIYLPTLFDSLHL